MKTSRFILAVAFLACLGWAIMKPAWDSICAALGALAALVLALTNPKAKREAAQAQVLGDGAIGIQAGRDVKVGDISSKRTS